MASHATRFSAAHAGIEGWGYSSEVEGGIYHWRLGSFLKCKHILLFDICRKEFAIADPPLSERGL